MFNKFKPFVVVILALSGLVLLMFSQAWAGPPRAQETIYQDELGNPLIKVVFENNGDFKEVYAWDGTLNGGEGDWSSDPITGQPAIICTCVDNDVTDEVGCSDTLSSNLDSAYVTVNCHEIINAGSGKNGCPVYGSPGYLYGGFFFGQ